MVESRRVRPSDRRRDAALRFHVLRVPRTRPDAPSRPVPPPELLGGEHRDLRDVCGPGDPVLLSSAVLAADRRLFTAEEWPDDAAGDRGHVSALTPLWRARGSLRPAFLYGRGSAGGAAGLLLFQRVGLKVGYVFEVRPALLVFSRGLSMTVAPLTAAVLAGAEKEAGIASGVNNAIARVAGLLGTAAVGAAVAQSFGSALDQRLAGKGLGEAARAAVRLAKKLPLGRPDVHGLPSAQARVLRSAAEQASRTSFHLGLM